MSPEVATFIHANWEALAGLAATIVGGAWTVFVFFATQAEPADRKPRSRVGRELSSPWNGVLLCVIGAGVLWWQLIASWGSYEQARVCGNQVFIGEEIKLGNLHLENHGDNKC